MVFRGSGILRSPQARRGVWWASLGLNRRCAVSRPQRLSIAIALVLVVSAEAGCISIGQVERVSAAGARYATAVDRLIDVTLTTSIDADSYRMLSEAAGTSKAARKTIFKAHEGAGQLVPVMEKLKRHAALLAAYFNALGALATSDAPARAQTSAEGAAAALNQLGAQLQNSPVLSSAEAEALGQFTGLAVTAVQRHLVAKEIRERADLIDQQLRIHATLTRALGEKLEADTRSISTLGMQRETEDPFVAGTIKNEQAWTKARRQYLLQAGGVTALEEASEAATKLREAWVAIVTRKFDEVAFQDLLKDVALLVSTVETARKLQ